MFKDFFLKIGVILFSLCFCLGVSAMSCEDASKGITQENRKHRKQVSKESFQLPIEVIKSEKIDDTSKFELMEMFREVRGESAAAQVMLILIQEKTVPFYIKQQFVYDLVSIKESAYPSIKKWFEDQDHFIKKEVLRSLLELKAEGFIEFREKTELFLFLVNMGDSIRPTLLELHQEFKIDDSPMKEAMRAEIPIILSAISARES